MLELPPHFRDVPYNAAHYPGNAAGLREGANCQHFAFELLRHFGLSVPDFRSSELWEDEVYSEHVAELAPLDLLLWNHVPEAYGAHVGVFVGSGKAVHLAKAQGRPVIWPLRAFTETERYRYYLGAKRFKR